MLRGSEAHPVTMTNPSRIPDRNAWPARLALALVLGLALATGAAAAGNKPKDPPTDEALIAGAGLSGTDVGYLVVDLADKRVLAERNPDRLFVPASVAKIPTFAAAIDILGADYRFATTLGAEGTITDGVLTGSLILRGGGDPFLTGDDLQAMAKQLAASGVSRVDGAFLYDASAMITLPAIDAMQPEAAGYNCGVSALSINFNRVRLRWQKSGDGRSATAIADSKQLKLPLDGISIAFADDDLPGPFVRSGLPAAENWLLSANLPAKGEDWLPVGNPARVAAAAFRAIAARQGIDLPEPAAGVMPSDAREIVRHESVPLAEMARAVLRSSNNLSAELVGLAASQALTGKKLSLADSGAALADWWRKRLPGADWTGLLLENHSGLSSKSRTTPRHIVAMLEEASGRSGDADFHELLRKTGWKGVKASAHTKTGTMAYVRGLAGYIDTVAGHRLAFAIFSNDADKRAALDAAFDPHVRVIDQRSRSWRNRVLRLEGKLTEGWAKRF